MFSNHHITKEIVSELYNEDKDGLMILKNVIPLNKINELISYIEKNKGLFQDKREKYIENNQKVCLLYRGGFDMECLSNTIFKEIMMDYVGLRKKVDEFSDRPFQNGNSLEVKLIFYPISKLGVGIHKDLSSNVNLIVFYNLKGTTSVRTYANKAGDAPVDHFIGAGDVSIMRGPREGLGDDFRPYHGVEAVNEERMVLVIREINEVIESQVNKDNWMGF